MVDNRLKRVTNDRFKNQLYRIATGYTIVDIFSRFRNRLLPTVSFYNYYKIQSFLNK